MSEIQSEHHVPEQIIGRVRPDHETITWYDTGDNRDVAVVDGCEAFRFPKEESGREVGRYEFEILKLVQGRLSVEVPKPIEFAPDGSYNVLSFLPGKVLDKQAARDLPLEKRYALGVSIATVINELNRSITRDELLAIPSIRPLKRGADDYLAAVYKTATSQDTRVASVYRQNYERMQASRPDGFNDETIVFGDFSPPNLVLSEDDRLLGVIDWTELGFGDIHRELRPVYSVIGPEAFAGVLQTLDKSLGPIDQDLVQLCDTVYELAVLVGGKQKGVLTDRRRQYAVDSLNRSLGHGWES